MIVENKNGYKLLEYIPINEEDIDKYENITSAGVVFEVNGKYLIGWNNWRKQWELAVGGIEKEETPREAAKRELLEETHQEVDYLDFKGLFKKARPTGEIVYTAIYYTNKDQISEFIKNDLDENDKIMLWDLKENIGDVDEIDKEIIKLVMNI